MRNIAIVEDEDLAAEALKRSIARYGEEYGCEFNIQRFSSAEEFLNDYKSVFAVVFMDIQMSGMNGMDAAYKLRETDKTVSLVFITSLVQYAQKGYEVDAVGYLLKPVAYYDFALKFRKALDIYLLNEDHSIVVEVAGGMVRISCDKLIYVEILKHRLYYHMIDGVAETTGVLSAAEKELGKYGFLRCNNCYIVNPRFVVSVRGSVVNMGHIELIVSRPRRAKFLTKLAEWFASSGLAGGDKKQ